MVRYAEKNALRNDVNAIRVMLFLFVVHAIIFASLFGLIIYAISFNKVYI